jgi:hypothetical protein
VERHTSPPHAAALSQRPVHREGKAGSRVLQAVQSRGLASIPGPQLIVTELPLWLSGRTGEWTGHEHSL